MNITESFIVNILKDDYMLDNIAFDYGAKDDEK